MPRRTVVSVLLCLLFAPSADAAWHRLDSPNFVVVGDASERQLREVAVKFEAFTEILGRLRGKGMAIAPVPTVILVFRSDKAFDPYKPRYQGKAIELDGLFVPGADVNHIAFVNDGTERTLRVMYHEYAHLVIANAAGRIPVWLNEGLSEVYSTFELTRDGRQALIGRPVGEHLALLARERLLKLPELLQVDHSSPLYNEGERRSVFYAQSWALAHMISFGEPPRTEQLGAYLVRLAHGASPADAWKDAFGAERIDHELARYVTRASYRAIQHRFSDKLAQFDAKARPVAPDEVQAYLAHFLLAQRRREEAVKLLAASGDQNLLVRAVRAHLDVDAGDCKAAVKRLAAVENADDWLAAYYGGVGISDCVGDERELGAAPIAAANRFFDTAGQQRAFPNAVIQRALMALSSDATPTDATILAVQGARNAAPGREDYAFVHAQLLARRADFAAARSIAGPLLASTDPRVRENGRSLMKWILELEQYHAASRSAQTPQPTSSPESAAQENVQRVEPVFRKLQEGEERTDGVLQRIECSRTRRAVTFVLQAGKDTVRLSAARMQDVEFITYRDDLGGDVSCGALKEPMRVYVTSRAAAKPDGPRDVVAIEFLPKEMP